VAPDSLSLNLSSELVKPISRTLTFSPRSPKRSQPKPGKCYGEANCSRQAAAAPATGMILFVLLHSGGRKTDGQEKENNPGHLQPQLVCGASERSTRGADAAHDRGECTAPSGLLPGHPRYHPQLPQSRNLVHGLDFNSLRGYNGATLENGDDETANRCSADSI
jgi:hypothetical protein